MASVKRFNFAINVPRGQQRFRELIIYVSKESERDPYFGAIKLNKILYYSDFFAFERFGVPLTGLPYFRLPFGPAPQLMVPIRADLIKEGAIEIKQVDVGGHLQDRTIALRDPYLSLFSKDELSLVDGIIKTFWGQSATEVSLISHDVRWRTLNDRDALPYDMAYLDDEITDDDRVRTEQLARELGW